MDKTTWRNDDWDSLAVHANNGRQGAGAVVEAHRRTVAALDQMSAKSSRQNRVIIWLTVQIFVLTAATTFLAIVTYLR